MIYLARGSGNGGCKSPSTRKSKSLNPSLAADCPPSVFLFGFPPLGSASGGDRASENLAFGKLMFDMLEGICCRDWDGTRLGEEEVLPKGGGIMALRKESSDLPDLSDIMLSLGIFPPCPLIMLSLGGSGICTPDVGPSLTTLA